MARKALIQIRRGFEKDIGILAQGELGYCTDTMKLYIGTAGGNELLVAASSTGDMLKSIYDTNNDGKVDAAAVADNAAKVNNLTVLTAVPVGAKFTDTVYTHPSTHPATIITEDSTHRFIDDVGKNKLTSLSLAPQLTTTEVGDVDPLWYALRTGKQFCLDEDFAVGTNSVGVYNNSGGSAVTVSRIQLPTAPNSSRYVLEIRHNGGATSPNYGGVVQNIHSVANGVFIQLFRAKLPVGYYFATASNSMGNGYTDGFITSSAGTGKWETYARVVLSGSSGIFSSGGHLTTAGSPAPTSSTNLVWHIASMTHYQLNARSSFTWNQLKGV